MNFCNNRQQQHGLMFWKHQYFLYLHQSKQVSRMLAEGTMTCISLVMMFMFLVCLSSSHRGDKAVLGLSLVESRIGRSAFSPMTCCACCFASFPCQSYIKDLRVCIFPSALFQAVPCSVVLYLLFYLWRFSCAPTFCTHGLYAPVPAVYLHQFFCSPLPFKPLFITDLQEMFKLLH